MYTRFDHSSHYGLQAIAKPAGDLVDAMMSYTKRINYVELF
ncbi:hypothetical protein [Candidatus Enterovibrio escicola]|uniref:Uncharacterized protein n=1 Tax=Candidatus Enterovibrio escicola TaxID=1927127 RepID=A0A2A5T0H6_9GAMM|nr:hypothetical protein BTN49_2677 [Candidatus Enterovibrio escacola]